LATCELPGVSFLPVYFRPTFDKWCDQRCGGISIQVTDAEQFRSVRTSIAILRVVNNQWPREFQWLEPPYEYETQKPPIDIIYGSSKLRDNLGSAVSIKDLAGVDANGWGERTAAIQIYDPGINRFRG
jgi:uncharacterized protein YbbC (DUF1343 family)